MLYQLSYVRAPRLYCCAASFNDVVGTPQA